MVSDEAHKEEGDEGDGDGQDEDKKNEDKKKEGQEAEGQEAEEDQPEEAEEVQPEEAEESVPGWGYIEIAVGVICIFMRRGIHPNYHGMMSFVSIPIVNTLPEEAEDIAAGDASQESGADNIEEEEGGEGEKNDHRQARAETAQAIAESQRSEFKSHTDMALAAASAGEYLLSSKKIGFSIKLGFYCILLLFVP